MKNLIIIIGPNGVGKSMTAKEFIRRKPNCAFVDSDWCRVKIHLLLLSQIKNWVLIM